MLVSYLSEQLFYTLALVSYINVLFTYDFTVCLFHGICYFHHSSKFSKMARYDMSGIGINLREVPDDTGGVKLKVLGLILDGPAQVAGVRQVSKVAYIHHILYLNLCTTCSIDINSDFNLLH